MCKRFRDIQNVEEARAYYEGLGERWPERTRVVAHLCDQVALLPEDGRIVELCAGGGQLAYPLLERFPKLRYMGLDLSTHGIEYARAKLARFGDRAQLYTVDLNAEEWLDLLAPADVQPIDAWISLQSLHDLGDAAAIARIYALTYALLRPGGRWILADLLAQSTADPAADPGRLTVERQLELFAAAGYADARCTMETRNFGCFVAAREA